MTYNTLNDDIVYSWGMNNILYQWPSYHHNSFLCDHPLILGVCVKDALNPSEGVEYICSVTPVINHRKKTAIAYILLFLLDDYASVSTVWA